MNAPSAGVLGGLRARLASPSTRGGYALVGSGAITCVIGVVFWGVGARWWSADELGRGPAIVAAMVLASLVPGLVDLDLASGRGVMKQGRMAGINPPELTNDMTAAIVATMGMPTMATLTTVLAFVDERETSGRR